MGWLVGVTTATRSFEPARPLGYGDPVAVRPGVAKDTFLPSTTTSKVSPGGRSAGNGTMLVKFPK